METVDDATTRPRPDYDRLVLHFCRAMIERLEANRDRGGWLGLSQAYLVRRMLEEVGELVVELLSSQDDDLTHLAKVRHEAADAANFLMMIVDNLEADVARSAGLST